MKLRDGHFSLRETELLKGLAILVIVFHNFFHVLLPIIGENEFLFDPQNFFRFRHTLLDHPADIVRALFSYLGHYAVHVFIFLSAYGLSRRYRNEMPKFGVFFKDRFDKIYPSFLICLLLFLVVKTITGGAAGLSYEVTWQRLLWKVLLISNFVPDEATSLSGPWWFIPFIIQFYLIFPPMLRAYQWLGDKFLMFVVFASVLGEIYLNPILIAHGLNWNYMVFGHLPVLCLGMFMANQASMIIELKYFFAATSLFVLANFSGYAWLFSDLAFTVMAIAASIAVINSGFNRPALSATAVFFGGLSFQLFMVNGFLRPPFVKWAESLGGVWAAIFGALLALAVATAVAYCLRWFDGMARGFYRRMVISTV